MALLTASLTFSTLLGGLVALRHRDNLHLILGLISGVLVAVVAFDLLPEIMQLDVKLNAPRTLYLRHAGYDDSPSRLSILGPASFEMM